MFCQRVFWLGSVKSDVVQFLKLNLSRACQNYFYVHMEL